MRLPILLSLLSFGHASAAPVTLEDFSQKSVEQHGWRVVDDGVMGGLSKGRIQIANDGVLTFHGTLSLENNGGFSSIQTKRVDLDLSASDAVTLRVRGDGRTYQLRITTDARWRGRLISFKAEFTAPDGEWQEVTLPFSAFTGTFRGRDLPDEKFDPSTIRRLGLLIADNKAGPFELEVDWIRSGKE